MTEKDKEKIRQLQLSEQSLQSLLLQKQVFQTQLSEIMTALEELEGSTEHYKIIGNIMVKAEKEKLKNDLLSKKELSELRIRSIEKQEDEIKKRMAKLQSEILEEVKKKSEKKN